MLDGQHRAEAESAKIHADLGDMLLFTRELNIVEGVDYWIVQVPIGILHAAWEVQMQLTSAVQLQSIPKLAFLCRNALELHIWARYVSSSPEEAKRFHQDAYVDGVEVLKLMDKAFKHTPTEVHTAIRSQIDRLIPEFERILLRDKVGSSVAELRSMNHLQVGAVAKEVGYEPTYQLWNPILSELVHATAYNSLIAGKDMDVIGIHLVERTVVELRSAVASVDRYLEKNRLPRYQVG